MTTQSTSSVQIAPRDERSTGLVARCRRRALKMRKRLSNAARNGQPSRFAGLCRVMLSSYSCKLAALHHANRRVEPSRWVSDEQLEVIAANLNLWTPSEERALVWSAPKSSGGHRLFISYGLRDRAKQILVKWTMESWIRQRLMPQQHHLNGGRPAAVRATSTTIEEGGHRYGIELDIRDCYGSISTQWLKEALPLPTQVIDYVCTAGHLTLVPMDTMASSHLQRCRRGLPQGSAVSPLLAEFVVASVLATVPQGIDLQVYVDNVFCSARSREELRRDELALKHCFAVHPSGFFAVRASQVQDLKDGFAVLGYNIERRWRKAVIRVSDARHSAFACRVERLSEQPGQTMKQRRAATSRLIRGWFNAHSLWWGAKRTERQLRSHIRLWTPCSCYLDAAPSASLP